MFSLYYNLNKQISGEEILRDIQSLINKFSKHSQDNNPILCITIKSVSYDTDSFVPKLEHKESND